MSAGGITRRTALVLAGSAALLPQAWPVRALAQQPARRHGLAVIGDLKYAPDFKHFDYVNPDAPKGGLMVTQSPSILFNQNFNTFNTMNMFVLRGDGPQGMQYTYASLMAGSSDEPGSVYPYVAREVEVSDDTKTLTFFMRPEAAFHDGSPITAADVVFSFEVLRDKGHPLVSQELKEFVTEAVAVDDHTVRFQIAAEAPIGMPVSVAGLPIFSKAWWATRNFEGSLSEIPLGSGPYKVRDYRFGGYIAYERVDRPWADDLPVMKGRFNFATLRYDYYLDRTAAFESLKKGDTTLREEFTSRVWARDYNFPAVIDGRVKRDEIPDGAPSGAQAWFFNLRRKKFADPRVREALALVFDFEWTNKNIMYDSYYRVSSFFENSPLKAEGTPAPEELAILEPLRGQIPDASFREAYVPPVTDGSGRDRKMLQRANALLMEAGCTRQGNALHLPDGERITIEFLDDDNSFEAHHNAYINGLRLLGVEATYRVVDAAQFRSRINTFDFDMTVQRFVMGLTPDEIILQFFSTKSASQEGSRNLSGIGTPAIDILAGKVAYAKTWDEFVTATRALDRVLRASHFWVPQWYKASHWLAYWDMYERPAIKPPYDRAVLDTWWVNAEKAAKLGKA